MTLTPFAIAGSLQRLNGQITNVISAQLIQTDAAPWYAQGLPVVLAETHAEAQAGADEAAKRWAAQMAADWAARGSTVPVIHESEVEQVIEVETASRSASDQIDGGNAVANGLPAPARDSAGNPTHMPAKADEMSAIQGSLADRSVHPLDVPCPTSGDVGECRVAERDTAPPPALVDSEVGGVRQMELFAA